MSALRNLLLLTGAISLLGGPRGLAEGDSDGLTTSLADKPSEIFLEGAVFNWGSAFRGAQLEHTFTIENRGGSPLILEGTKPSCGCMSLKDEAEAKKTLQPGEKSTITLLIDTQILEPGSIKNKYTEILSNAASGENRLWVEGEIKALFILEPAQPKLEVIRGLMPPKTEPTTFSMKPVDGHEVRITSMKPRKGLLSATFSFKPEKGFVVSMLPTLKDRAAFQNDALDADVQVDGAAIPFRVPVSITLKDRIDVGPSPSIYFHKKDTESFVKGQGTKPQKTLELFSIGGQPHQFQVIEAGSKEQVFSVKTETIEKGKRYRLIVTLEKAPQKGERFLKDTVEIKTDDPEVPVVSIRGSAQF
jgi:hypothetical protein